MRILHVTDTFLPRLGGIELHVADLAARQRAAGHDVLVLTAERAGSSRSVGSGSPVPVTRWAVGRSGAGTRALLPALLDGFVPDVVHGHLTVGSPFTWAVLRHATGTPSLATMHSLLPDSRALVRAGLFLSGIPTRTITFSAVSEVAAVRLRAGLAPQQPVHVLHNGIDPTHWQVDRSASETFHIVTVGRLAARKRPLVLIDALGRLARRAPDLDWTAALIGEGNQRAKVLGAVRAHGLEHRVVLAGPLSRRQIRDELARADVFVAPAKLESFGIAALEARCAGVPVVGMAQSGVTEFITDGRDGLLAYCDDDIARALHRLATDADLMSSIRRHNLDEPVGMAWDRVIAQHDALYASVLAGARPAYGTATSKGQR